MRIVYVNWTCCSPALKTLHSFMASSSLEWSKKVYSLVDDTIVPLVWCDTFDFFFSRPSIPVQMPNWQSSFLPDSISLTMLTAEPSKLRHSWHLLKLNRIRHLHGGRSSWLTECWLRNCFCFSRWLGKQMYTKPPTSWKFDLNSKCWWFHRPSRVFSKAPFRKNWWVGLGLLIQSLCSGWKEQPKTKSTTVGLDSITVSYRCLQKIQEITRNLSTVVDVPKTSQKYKQLSAHLKHLQNISKTHEVLWPTVPNLIQTSPTSSQNSHFFQQKSGFFSKWPFRRAALRAPRGAAAPRPQLPQRGAAGPGPGALGRLAAGAGGDLGSWEGTTQKWLNMVQYGSETPQLWIWTWLKPTPALWRWSNRTSTPKEMLVMNSGTCSRASRADMGWTGWTCGSQRSEKEKRPTESSNFFWISQFFGMLNLI